MGHYGTVGLQMGLSVARGLALDKYLGTAPWMALIFLILGKFYHSQDALS